MHGTAKNPIKPIELTKKVLLSIIGHAPFNRQYICILNDSRMDRHWKTRPIIASANGKKAPVNGMLKNDIEEVTVLIRADICTKVGGF